LGITQVACLQGIGTVHVNDLPELHGRRCLFFAGLLGTQRGIAATRAALEALYGIGRVSVVESLASTDRPSPHRLSLLAAETCVHDGDSLDLILHSGGAIEYCAAAAEALRQGANPEHGAECLRIFLVSPAGIMSGLFDTVLTATRLATLARSMFADGFWKGVDSLSVVPPDPIEGHRHFEAELRRAVGTTSLFSGCGSSVEPVIDKSSFLWHNPDAHRKVAAIDERVLESAKLSDRPGVVQAMTERGHVLAKECSQAFDGTSPGHEKLTHELPDWLLPGRRSIAGGVKDFISLLRSVPSHSPRLAIGNLVRAGALVRFLVPEYDTAMRPRDAVRAMRSWGIYDPVPSITALPCLTHAGFAIRPAVLAAAIKTTRINKVGCRR
jgi:hypothetical protein